MTDDERRDEETSEESQEPTPADPGREAEESAVDGEADSPSEEESQSDSSATSEGDESAAAGESTSVAATLAAAPTPAAGSSAAAAPTASATRRGVLYRIATDNTWEEIWNTPDVIYDVATQADGGVLVASGPEGRLYKVDRNLDVSLLTGVDARQITRFAPGARGGALTAFATAAPGRVMTVGTGEQATARYISVAEE